MPPPILIDRTMMKCPIFQCICSEKWSTCAWSLEQDRKYDSGEVYKVKACCLWVSAEATSMESQRLGSIQTELGEMKNNHTYEVLALMGVREAQTLLYKRASKYLKMEEQNGRLPQTKEG